MSCGIDAFVWLPTFFATVKMFQQPGQADHGARAMPARLDSEVTHKYAALHSQQSLCSIETTRLCDHGAPWDALEQSGIHKSTHAPDFQLQFWYLVRGIVAGGGEEVLCRSSSPGT